MFSALSTPRRLWCRYDRSVQVDTPGGHIIPSFREDDKKGNRIARLPFCVRVSPAGCRCRVNNYFAMGGAMYQLMNDTPPAADSALVPSTHLPSGEM